MSAHTSNASLLLHPQDPDWTPDDPAAVIGLLQRIGLAAEKLPGHTDAYLAGGKFLDLIAFMGCSPSISFTPDDGAEHFSFIRLISTPDHISAFTGTHSHAPHCPHCNKAEKNWREQLASENTLCCSACGQSAQPWLYNWRKSAGFARFFIEVTGIYPKEAIPRPELLSALESIDKVTWKYFYHYP